MSLLIASKKGKWIIGGVCVFALVATASTGLASWVIGQQNSANTEGNINVSTIDDQSCTVTLNGGLDLTVNFGPLKGDFPIINTSEAESEEDLTFTLKGNITYTSGTYSKVKVTFDTSNITSFVGEYITLPTQFKTSEGNIYSYEITCGDETTVDSTTKKREFSEDFKFGWGSKFGGSNPCKYFDNNEGRDYNAAKAALEGLKSLSAKTFSITVTPVLG